MLSANVIYPYMFGGKRGGRNSDEGSRGEEEVWSRQRQCWNDANFGAMGSLQAEQDQMDDSSKWKSAV